MAKRTHWWTDRWLEVSCRVSSVVCGAPRLVSRVSCLMSRVSCSLVSCLVSRVLASRVSCLVCLMSCRVVCRVRLKVVRMWCVCSSLTSTSASRRNGAHFFDVWTSKNAPKPPVFYTFDFEMCFSPQCRALFEHLNFQKCSEHAVFCTFLLPNVLRATTACAFSTSQLPKVLWCWGVFSILSWKCASRHNCVHFCRHLNFQKRFYLFAHLQLLSSDYFSSSYLPSVHIVGSLTSKLPHVSKSGIKLRSRHA